jgi:DNA-3-methyladenine glycosylase
VTREELARDPEVVAVALLGCRLAAGGVTVRLVEVEAYGGASDPASHAYRGERPRTRTMFGPPGHLYVYLSYGLHSCMNVVCWPAGRAGAVLLRGGRVVDGLDEAESRRGRPVPGGLLDGPGKFCQALGIDRGADGTDLLDPGSPIRLLPGPPRERSETVVTGPRVGITKAAERPWRFRLLPAP